MVSMGKKNKRRKVPAPDPESWWIKFKKTHLKLLVGPGVIAFGVGMQLMSYSAAIGTFIVYAGILVCIFEVAYESWFVKNDYKFQIIVVGMIALFFAWFTIDTFPTTKIEVLSALTVGLGQTAEVEGIPWDQIGRANV
jgi:hypothetical protein